MSTTTLPVAIMSVSRPKIHKPPAFSKHQEKAGMPGFLLFWGVVLLALIALTLTMNREDRERETVIKAAATLPEVAIVSQRLPAAPAVTETPAAPAPQHVLAAATPPVAQPQKPSSTIVLQDHGGGIVGQMAKIPVENEQITEVKTINDVDNGGGRELLSIVGKY